jgi:hypothetical protein
MNSQWPEPKAHLHVCVLVEEKTDTHTFTYRSDRLLSIEATPNAPEIVKKAAGQEQTLINHAGMQALRRLMDRIDALGAQAS